MKQKVCFGISLIIMVIAVILLTSGSSLLTIPVLNEIEMPLGTLISWIGMISLPAAIYYGNKNIYDPKSPGLKRYRNVVIILIAMSILWGFVCYLLADNWAFIFKQQSQFRGSASASIYFWIYTFMIALLPIVFLLVYKVDGFLNHKKEFKQNLFEKD